VTLKYSTGNVFAGVGSFRTGVAEDMTLQQCVTDRRFEATWCPKPPGLIDTSSRN
jgi:hypothetical protein